MKDHYQSKFLAIFDEAKLPILGDGAMGTMLNSRGVGFNQCFDALNLTNPALVADIHRAYIEAGAQIIFVPFCTDERYAYLRVRYCAQARCVENHVYVAMAGTVGNLPDVENMDIQYAQACIFTPSDIPFTRDGIAAECTPNVETVVIDDVDLELLKRHRQTGSVLNWRDRRTDLYEVRRVDAPARSRSQGVPAGQPPSDGAAGRLAGDLRRD